MADYPTVEMYLNSAWTDITQYVYYRDRISITRGRSGEGAQTDTSVCTMTLNNRDGRFSPRNPEGAYYGQLGRNTQLRVSVDGGYTYLDAPGGASDRVSTPDAAALDITGDIDIRMEFDLDEVPSGGGVELASKYLTTGDQRSWLVYLTGTGQIAFRWSTLGTLASNIEKQSSATNFYPFVRKAIRITLDADDGSGNNVVTFYTADSIDGDWTALSSTTTAGTTSIFSSSASLELGEIPGLASNPMQGRIHKFELYDGIDGTLVANPDFNAQTAGATSFADGSGLTWTLNGNTSLTNRKTRFVGEISALDIDSDRSGTDAAVKLTASGIMRRLGQGNNPLDSALLRFIKDNNPIECYPLTEGSLSTYGAPFNSTSNRMTPALTSGTKTPAWSGGELNDWTENVVAPATGTDGRMRGNVPSSTSADTGWSVDFFFSGVTDGSIDLIVADIGPVTDADPRIGFTIDIDQDNDRIQLTIVSVGDTTSSTALLTTVSSPGVFDDNAHHVRLTAVPASPNTTWTLYVDGEQEATGSYGLLTKRLRFVQPGWFLNAVTTGTPCFGYVTYWGASAPTAANIYDALQGERGETVGTRLSRVLDEESITYQRIGSSTTVAMDPQPRDTLLDVLREGETADLGFLYEPREVLGLAYRDQASLYNQSAAITLDYDQNQLAEALIPVEDDQTVRNDVTAKQPYGSSYRVTYDSGTLSTLNPPDGVGRYDESVEVNINDADDLPSYANWRLHLGTVDEARYPQISLNLRHTTFTSSTALMDAALSLDIGDRIVIRNPPAWLPPDDIELVAVGFSETLGIRERDLVINCVPASPYNVADTDVEHHADTDGTTLSAAVNSSATSLDVYTQVDSAIWTTDVTDLPFDIKVSGEVMQVEPTGMVLTANPDFETDTTGWTATNATLVRSSEQARVGEWSGKLTTSSGSNPRAQDANRAVTAGSQYTTMGWLYAPSELPTDAGVSVNWFDSGGVYLSTTSNTTTLTPGVWTSFVQNVTAPVSAAFAGVHFVVSGTPGSGYVLYGDNVKLIDGVDGITSWLEDAFGRTEASGWGDADSGQTWGNSGGSASDYAVGSGYGSHTLTTTNASRRTFTDFTYTGIDYYGSLTVDATATGAPIRAGLTARYADSDNLYFCRFNFLTSGGLELQLRKRVSAVESSIGSTYTTGITYSPGTFYRMRFQVDGSTLRAKAWLASDTEPVVWHIEETDTDLTSSLFVGTRSIADSGNTNTNPQVRFDNLEVVNPQVMQVTRSVNGVSKSQSAGADIRLAQPAIVAR